MRLSRIGSVCVLVALVAVVFLARASGVSVSAQQAPSPAVTINDFSFGPSTLTVAAGATVTWSNRDSTAHTVVSTEDAFKSKAIDTNEKFEYKFAKPGTYSYFCSIHPEMTGKVVVQ